MSDPNLDNISIQEYLDMSLPDHIDSSNEAVLYPQFFRNFVFRRVGDINNTNDIKSLVEWPKGAVIHDIYQNFLMNKPIELVPDLTSAPLAMKPKKKYVLHQTEPVPPTALKYEEEFILPMAGVVTTIINFKKRNQRFTRPITVVTKFPKASMSDVLNVISYESLYRARILGMLWAKQHRRFKYIWTNIINNIAAMPDRQHFIPIPVGERAYERSKFLLSFKKYDKMSIMHPNDPWYLFMMHFVGFMHCFPTESIFEKIPKNLLGNIHFALFSKREFVIYNLEKLKAFNTDSDALLLRFITQVNSLSETGGYRCEESVDYGDRDTVHDSVEDPTELTIDDDELFSDTDPVEGKPISRPFGMYVVPKQDKPEETVSVPVATGPQPTISADQTKQLQEAELKFKAASADLIKNASADSDVTADTIEIKVGNSVVKDDRLLSPEVEKPVPVAKMSPAAVAKAMAEAKDEFSDLNISPTYIEIDDKFLTLTSATNDLNAPKYKEEVTQQELEANTAKFVEEIETKTKEFVEQAEDLTKAQRERAEKMSKVWETLPVNGKTIKEIVSETPNEAVDHRELTFLQDDPDIVDKSMLESSLDRFDKDYMDKMFMKDMLSNMLKFNTLGMFLKDINITDISDSLNNLLDIAVKFEDVRHKEHSFHFSIPKVDENGYIKLNGGLKVLKKQRIDMPICKISPTIVRLSSDSNKYRIIRNETSAHNFLAYIGRMIRKAGAKVKVEYNQFNYNNIKLPYEYTELATKYGTITIDGALSLCLFFDYEHRFDIVAKFNFGDEKLKTIKINERKFEGVLIGVDRYRSEYYSKLDGSTVIVDAQGNVVKTTLIDILCDEMEVTMTPLSEWIDMNLLGKLYIPVIFVLAYRFGLSNMLEYTKTKYFVLNKNERMQRNWSDVVVRFKDKTLIIPRHPLINSLIFSGLNAFDLKDVMMEDMDGKDIYYDLLRSKGKSTNFLKGIDNYFDLFMDAQTRDVLLQMKEPTDTRDLLIRAVQLLSTEDHNPTASASNYRFRSYERFNTAIYKTLSMSFANWRAKGLGATHKWSIPDYEIMKMISEDQLLENVDTINPVNDIKYHHEFSHSGIGGRSSVDTFMVNDRQFPADGVGTMTEATVDSSKTGYAGSLSTNPIITNLRGMVITKDPDELKPTQMVSVTAVLFPFGTHDDGKRQINIEAPSYSNVR